ncbi:hypothetical protein A8H31_15675 [Burkholderia thailandensis]|nr:hypothetical protein A8H31_15675 [Burkholderia thailandensis]PNE68990.1 hypothetical protein A8H38_23510 [Burkholderia thailandensis]PNE81008.1 hypothetical protein A8H34_24155 [Burkholderia thailandensis]PNE86953.1 hypothetical protein A8H30_23815 [Burkholderia thailandensis]
MTNVTTKRARSRRVNSPRFDRSAFAFAARWPRPDTTQPLTCPRYYLPAPIIGALASQARHDSRLQSQS